MAVNRANLWLVGSLALALGAFVSIAIYRDVRSRAGIDVVVAASDIQLGTKIQDKEVELVRYPTDEVPPNCFHQKSSVVGHGVILPIAKGEFILPNNLADDKAGRFPPGITPIPPPPRKPLYPPLIDPPVKTPLRTAKHGS